MINREDTVKAAYALAIATNLIVNCDIAGSEKCWMKAAEFAGHEGLDSEVNSMNALTSFFESVCKKKDVGAGVINCLMSQISLQARGTTKCLAIIGNYPSGSALVK